ncbi:unnamed protein product [Lactuca saligna]|uniref:Uncharacterized protein n=1 Tax=Lactuca saligna TaxID=75948 RepID=A0AA35YG78_LACSI|nr:unnamed protein product [Lactuca saligna]
MLLCSALNIPPSVTLFRHFYITVSNGDWVSFSLRHGLVELYYGLPTSVKWWNVEFFFVDTSAFSSPMAYGATSDRGLNAPPELSIERENVDRKKPIETMVGQEVTLIDCLHKKRLSDSLVVVKEVVVLDSHSLFESSMDSTMNPPSLEALVSLVSSLMKKNVKAESGKGKP